MGEETFNPDMLALARKIKGVTQKELHIVTQISQAQLSKFEQGLQIPTASNIEKLSVATGFPQKTFYIDSQFTPAIIPIHRKQASLGKKILERADSIGNLKVIHLDMLLEWHPISYELEILPESIASEPEKAAAYVREALEIPLGPIENLISLLEKVGIFVFLENFPSRTLDGFTLIGGRGTRPVLFINKEVTGDRERLNIAHELGHALMHTVVSKEAEDEAWAFAAELLMPKAEITFDLRDAKSLPHFARLKQKWKVSMAALMLRSYRLGIITEPQYRYLMMQMAPYRRQEPVSIPQEMPVLFDKLLNGYKEKNQLSMVELAEKLGLTPHMFTELYGNQTQEEQSNDPF
jgi:Zn-dependent peptidase ImmA (M78 family)